MGSLLEHVFIVCLCVLARAHCVLSVFFSLGGVFVDEEHVLFFLPMWDYL